MEQPGQIVWRLFSPVILKYVKMYEEAEKHWDDQLGKFMFFEADYRFVSKLTSYNLRMLYWCDKISFLCSGRLPQSLAQFQRTYTGIDGYWYIDPLTFQTVEHELLALLKHLSDHRPGFRKLMPRLSTCLESSYPFSLI